MINTIKEKIRKTKLYDFVGNYFFIQRAKSFDKKYKVETAQEVRLHELKIDSPNVEHGVFYAGTDPKSFRRIVDGLKIRFEDFTFIDLGSGKGRVLLMASELPFKEIIGVEFSPELNEIAQKNILSYENFEQKCQRISSICQDVTLYKPSAAPTVFYSFNAFHAQILDEVLKNIERAFREQAIEVYFIYANPVHNEVLQENKFFKEIYSDSWYSIYKNRD